MADFKVWCPDIDAEEDAKTIRARYPEDAAEAWAQDDHAQEPWEESEVYVRDENGTLFKYTVDAEVEITFSVTSSP